jgi:hypothetical protein
MNKLMIVFLGVSLIAPAAHGESDHPLDQEPDFSRAPPLLPPPHQNDAPAPAPALIPLGDKCKAKTWVSDDDRWRVEGTDIKKINPVQLLSNVHGVVNEARPETTQEPREWYLCDGGVNGCSVGMEVQINGGGKYRCMTEAAGVYEWVASP